MHELRDHLGFWRPSATIQKTLFTNVLSFLSVKIQKTFHSSMSNRICHTDSIAGNFETKARSLGMRLAKRGCFRPNTAIPGKSNCINITLRSSTLLIVLVVVQTHSLHHIDIEFESYLLLLFS